MPDGHVKWYDPKQDTGVVEHNGREYAVTGGEIDNHAQRSGAPVHFDIDRTDEGDIATAVTLRPGSRTSHTSHGVGDLAGAHHPSEKGQDEGVGEPGTDRKAYGQQPGELAADWVRFLSTGQLDRVVALYAPDAVVRVGERTIAGGDAIRRWLESSPLNGTSDAGAEVIGEQTDHFTVRWRTIPGDEAAVENILRIVDGAIAEQTTREAG